MTWGPEPDAELVAIFVKGQVADEMHLDLERQGGWYGVGHQGLEGDRVDDLDVLAASHCSGPADQNHLGGAEPVDTGLDGDGFLLRDMTPTGRRTAIAGRGASGHQ